MKYKFLISSALMALASAALIAQTTPDWLRHAAISPDGNTIAFCYQGDLYTVGADGGEARQITTNPAYESDPVWTPDGQSIVFSSTREESKDIWRVSPKGGTPVRLTTYQGAETPVAVYDGKVYFLADIQASAVSSNFPNTPQVYCVSLDGGKVTQVLPFYVGSLCFSVDGKLLYEDYKGVEDALRKHHTSSVTRDIWVREGDAFRQLSDYVGEDRNPVFAADGDTFYYLSERGGDCFNVWKSSLSQPSMSTRVTSFKTHPVRSLSISSGGRLLMSWNGGLYTCTPGSEPQKVEISLLKDKGERDVIRRGILGGISAIAPSANGKEVAVVAHGDVFVCAADFKSTRRITKSPWQERGVSFDPDGRTLYYAAERDGHWGIWRSSLVNKDDKYFSLAFDFKEEQFSEGTQTCFQPSVSPDGKWVAFLRDRSELVIKNTKSKEEKSLLKGVNYSYSDGDQHFSWSPDSRYILSRYDIDGGWNNSDIALIDIKSGEITNLTRSGYSDNGFRWALGGKAMTWKSDKFGYRSHGSWGSQDDVFAMFFDAEAYSKFRQAENEEKIMKALEEKPKKDDKKDEKDEKKEQKDSLKKAEKLVLDLEHRDDRTLRLTGISGAMGDHILSPDGTKLYYCVRLESSMDLCCRDLRAGSVKVVQKGVSGRFVPSADGKSVYVTSLFGVSKMNLDTGSKTSISFSGEYDYMAYEERSYIFEHIWKQMNEKFYDKGMHGVDWQLMHDNYVTFLPYINNNYDFQELLSEMLGEMNGSHTGARYRTSAQRSVGRLGVLFDMDYAGKGLRIAEVLPGSVLQIAVPELKAGDMILAVDGEEVAQNANWYDVLDRKSGKRVVLSMKCDGKKKEVALIAAGSDKELLYTRWVRHNEETVARLSGGQVGYVHVKSMDGASFNEVYSKALGKYRACKALIVDTRHNGGGWLHDDLVTFLSGRAYVEYRPQGQYIGTDPYNKWNKPSCMLVCEDNYSDASGTPYIYQALGIGKLVGSPVPGTMTAVWWETQIDNSLVFGIPQVTSWALKDDRPMENLQIEPDVKVYNDPASVIAGEDRQLEAAVRELLK